MFYCPSNPQWNNDTYWSNTVDSVYGNCVVVGYFHWVGDKNFNSLTWAGGIQYPAPLPTLPVFAIKTTDQPYYPLLWTDINRKRNGSWGVPGSDSHGVNHYNRQGDAPEGANEGYVDGHVEWVKASKFINARRMVRVADEYYFWGGR